MQISEHYIYYKLALRSRKLDDAVLKVSTALSVMEQAVAALKAAMPNNPTIEVPDFNANDDIFDYYNPQDCLHYRKEKVIIGGEEHSVRRVYYYKAGLSSAYCNVGWVLNSDCNACLKCNQHFSVFRAKHHCRIW